MFINADELPTSSNVECDICIAGSGPAGLTIASELSETSIQVCLLESGGLSRQRAGITQTPAEQLGVPIDVSKFCKQHFGGASNMWGGLRGRWFRSRPLDPLDFKERFWVPNSGWPITYEELKPFYERACKLLKLPRFDSFEIMTHRHRFAPQFHNGELHSSIFQESKPVRLGTHYRKLLDSSQNVRVYLHARVVDIEEAEGEPKINHFRFVSRSGNAHKVSAKRFVLACGALETPRLLLVSKHKKTSGVGNEYDLVGRYLMQHPKGRYGYLTLNPKTFRALLYTRKNSMHNTRCWAGITFDEAFQRRGKVLNHCIMFTPIFALPESYASQTYRALLRTWHGVPYRAEQRREMFELLTGWPEVAARAIKRFLKNPRFGTQFILMNHMEQVPKPESRLFLSEKRDQFGVRQLVVDWRIDCFEKRSLWRLHRLLQNTLERCELGRLDSDIESLIDNWPVSRDSGHYIGTTRMHGDPRRGVTDQNGRVHSVRNLYISGSSVFPTSGHANPTLTVVALAFRLADHLMALSRTDQIQTK